MASVCIYKSSFSINLGIWVYYGLFFVRVKNTPTIAAIYWIIIHHCAREEHAYHCCYLLNHHTSMCAWTTRLPLLLYIESLYITLRLELHIFILTLKYLYSHCRVILRTNQMDVLEPYNILSMASVCIFKSSFSINLGIWVYYGLFFDVSSCKCRSVYIVGVYFHSILKLHPFG
jgi:hypothetical protein